MFHIDDYSQVASDREHVNGNTFFVNADIDSAISFNPFTHIYMFDVGFPCQLHVNMAIKFNCSFYATYLISYKPPRFIINDIGFQVMFMNQFPTRMHGMYYIDTYSYYFIVR